MQLTSIRTQASGLTFHARVARRPGGPAVVLVHGIVVSSRYMIPVANELAGFASVWAPDLPGFGRSSKPRRVLDVPELADALAAWMEVSGLDRPAVLGNSFGCQVAVDLAIRQPGRVSRLVLVGPTVDRHARTAPRQIWRWAQSAFHERPSLPFVVARDALDSRPRRIWRTFRHSLRDMVEEELPRIDVPALVVRGARDPIVSQRWAEEVAALLPRGRLVVVPETGHALNYSAPRDLAALAREFLGAEA